MTLNDIFPGDILSYIRKLLWNRQLRASRALLPMTLYSHSPLVVLNRTTLSCNKTLLALNWRNYIYHILITDQHEPLEEKNNNKMLFWFFFFLRDSKEKPKKKRAKHYIQLCVLQAGTWEWFFDWGCSKQKKEEKKSSLPSRGSARQLTSKRKKDLHFQAWVLQGCCSSTRNLLVSWQAKEKKIFISKHGCCKGAARQLVIKKRKKRSSHPSSGCCRGAARQLTSNKKSPHIKITAFSTYFTRTFGVHQKLQHPWLPGDCLQEKYCNYLDGLNHLGFDDALQREDCERLLPCVFDVEHSRQRAMVVQGHLLAQDFVVTHHRSKVDRPVQL